jgi:cyanate lyase
MADAVRIENWPDSGSKEAVALSLAKLILNHQVRDRNHPEVYRQENVLKVYGACLKIVKADYGYDLNALL